MEKLEKLEKLTTKRLLAYYRAERRRRKVFAYGWQSITDEEMIAWDNHLVDVKKMLDGREHVE